MICKLFRLILLLGLFCSLYYISTWFIISFYIFFYNINIIEVFVVLCLIYLVLEYREYFYKREPNAFYHYFFWLLYIICIFVLYFAYFKVFILTVYKYEFLIQWKYFNIQILYSFKYKMEFFNETLNLLIEMFHMPEEKKRIILECMPKVVDYSIFERKITLDSIEYYTAAYIAFASAVYDALPFLTDEYNLFLFKQKALYQLYVFFRNMFLTFVIINSGTLFISNMLIKFYFSKYLYRYVFLYIQASNPQFFADMPMDVIIDRCKGVAELLIQRWDSREIIRFVKMVYEHWDMFFK